MVGSTYARLLRNANFLRIFSAGIGSYAGTSIAAVCLVWLVAADTGSALDVGFLGVAALVPAILVSTLGGTLVDRFDRRRLMVISDVVRALALGAVAAVLWTRGFDLATVLAASAVVGGFTVIFNPAEQALVPAIVSESEVADANGLVGSSRSAFQFVGAAVAGVLIVTVGPVTGVAVNAATFAISAALISGMLTPRFVPDPARPGYLADLRGGFAWLWKAQGFFQLTMSAMVFNFCSTVVGTFLVFYVTEVLHASALVFAALQAAQVAGLSLGSLLVGRLGAVRYAGKAWVVPYGIVSGVLALALPLWPFAPAAIGVMFVLGALGGFAGTAWLTAAQLLVPAEMQGRYYGIDGLGSYAILPAAEVGGALLIGAFGTSRTYLIAAIVWVIAGAAFLFARALWDLAVPPGRLGLTPHSDGDAAETPGSRGGTPGA
ncbi:MAG TPA: MFS transporter [Thermoplasmata archaeon]|nr:MFS transporter [Thermoplasmata archaeon]